MAVPIYCAMSPTTALPSSLSSIRAGSSTKESLSDLWPCCSGTKALLSVGRLQQGGVTQIWARNVPPKQGRGSNAKKATAEGIRRRIKGKEDLQGWTQVAESDDFEDGKNKAIIHNNAGYVLVKRGTELYSIEANCTACKFPVIAGEVNEQEEGQVSINCPLCHSKFSLLDGKVEEYCPKDGPLQWVVGVLKDKAPSAKAKVYPARISNSGRVYVCFLGASQL